MLIPIYKMYRKRFVINSFCWVIVMLGFSSISTAQDWSETQKIVPPDRAANDWFGAPVSISGKYAIVGSKQDDEDTANSNTLNNSGSAYIFEKQMNVGWVLVQKIVASDREADDQFATSVAISGNYAVVGARLEDEDASNSNMLNNAGSAYIFERDANGVWNEVQKIVASDREAVDVFGRSVSISGDIIVVGASFEDHDTSGSNFRNAAGSAYIFERDANGVWNEVQKIVASDRGTDDEFGEDLAIDGTYIIVGAWPEDQDEFGGNTMSASGSAYIFEKGTNGIWNEVQKIVASDRNVNDKFGWEVDISGNYAIVGAHHDDEDELGNNTLNKSGSAYIFERDANGVWNEVQKIVASDRETDDQFGNSVAINGIYAVVTSTREDENEVGEDSINGAGSAYIFKRDNGGSWNQIDKIVASDRQAGDRFGISVAVSGHNIIVGAYFEDHDLLGANEFSNAGSAYLYCGAVASEVSLSYVNDTLCDGDSTHFLISFASNEFSPDSMVWNFDDLNSGGDNVSREQNPSHRFTDNGSYNVQLIVYWPCKNDTIPTQISINLSSDQTEIIDTSICINDSVNISNNIYATAGTYFDTLVAMSGCDSILIITIDTDSCNDHNDTSSVALEPFIPNVFSPNGDGKSDFFSIYNINTNRIDLEIYDRMGNQVFKTTDPYFVWNGDYKGSPLAQGAYTYFLTLSDGKLRKGSVTLIH